MGCSGINYLNIKVYIKINVEQTTTVKTAKFFLVIFMQSHILIYSQSRYIATYQYNISRHCALKTNLTEFHVNLKAVKVSIFNIFATCVYRLTILKCANYDNHFEFFCDICSANHVLALQGLTNEKGIYARQKAGVSKTR
jgi:hypothetical protein